MPSRPAPLEAAIGGPRNDLAASAALPRPAGVGPLLRQDELADDR